MTKFNKHFLKEGWKRYEIPFTPKKWLYDFYVLSYLSTLHLDETDKDFRGSFTGRRGKDIQLDIIAAEKKFLPKIAKKLKDSLFLAVCAEIRHVFDNSQQWKPPYTTFPVFVEWAKNYKLATSQEAKLFQSQTRTNLSFSKRIRVKSPSYGVSVKAAVRALKKTDESPGAFIKICERAFKELYWSSSYGGPKWAEICAGYTMLDVALDKYDVNISAKQGEKFQVNSETTRHLFTAIDHAFDLAHNTDTVLNKVDFWKAEGGWSWVKRALDHKRNASMEEIVANSSDLMKKLAYEALHKVKMSISKKDKEYTPPAEKVQLSQSEIDEMIAVVPPSIFKYCEANGIMLYESGPDLHLSIANIQFDKLQIGNIIYEEAGDRLWYVRKITNNKAVLVAFTSSYEHEEEDTLTQETFSSDTINDMEGAVLNVEQTNYVFFTLFEKYGIHTGIDDYKKLLIPSSKPYSKTSTTQSTNKAGTLPPSIYKIIETTIGKITDISSIKKILDIDVIPAIKYSDIKEGNIFTNGPYVYYVNAVMPNLNTISYTIIAKSTSLISNNLQSHSYTFSKEATITAYLLLPYQIVTLIKEIYEINQLPYSDHITQNILNSSTSQSSPNQSNIVPKPPRKTQLELAGVLPNKYFNKLKRIGVTMFDTKYLLSIKSIDFTYNDLQVGNMVWTNDRIWYVNSISKVSSDITYTLCNHYGGSDQKFTLLHDYDPNFKTTFKGAILNKLQIMKYVKTVYDENNIPFKLSEFKKDLDSTSPQITSMDDAEKISSQQSVNEQSTGKLPVEYYKKMNENGIFTTNPISSHGMTWNLLYVKKWEVGNVLWNKETKRIGVITQINPNSIGVDVFCDYSGEAKSGDKLDHVIYSTPVKVEGALFTVKEIANVLNKLFILDPNHPSMDTLIVKTKVATIMKDYSLTDEPTFKSNTQIEYTIISTKALDILKYGFNSIKLNLDRFKKNFNYHKYIEITASELKPGHVLLYVDEDGKVDLLVVSHIENDKRYTFDISLNTGEITKFATELGPPDATYDILTPDLVDQLNKAILATQKENQDKKYPGEATQADIETYLTPKVYEKLNLNVVLGEDSEQTKILQKFIEDDQFSFNTYPIEDISIEEGDILRGTLVYDNGSSSLYGVTVVKDTWFDMLLLASKLTSTPLNQKIIKSEIGDHDLYFVNADSGVPLIKQLISAAVTPSKSNTSKSTRIGHCPSDITTFVIQNYEKLKVPIDQFMIDKEADKMVVEISSKQLSSNMFIAQVDNTDNSITDIHLTSVVKHHTGELIAYHINYNSPRVTRVVENFYPNEKFKVLNSEAVKVLIDIFNLSIKTLKQSWNKKTTPEQSNIPTLDTNVMKELVKLQYSNDVTYRFNPMKLGDYPFTFYPSNYVVKNIDSIQPGAIISIDHSLQGQISPLYVILEKKEDYLYIAILSHTEISYIGGMEKNKDRMYTVLNNQAMVDYINSFLKQYFRNLSEQI